MEGPLLPSFEAKIQRVRFGLATRQEISKASISDCPISHASQLSNPFLGLPLESGKCESCGTAEAGQCEGHFGYIELPTPIYHPDHVGELRRMLNLLCLKCLKLKNRKLPVKNIGIAERLLACCQETSQISIIEAKTTDGACYLELKMPSRSKLPERFWNFLEKYGFRYGDMHMHSRPLLPSEVMAILKKMPQETKKKLSAKGCFPQEGYIIQHLPVPPNCLSVPDISDGISTMSTDHSIALLKKVLRQVEIIKNSRSGKPNFESQEIEANDLQAAVAQYLQFRGTGKASRDVDTRFGVHKEVNTSSAKAWLEKMKTLFIRKGSGFSSRSVITGDPFKGVSEIGLPFEIAQKITYEERVNEHNREFLQKLVDEKLCLTYRDGMSTYSLREGSKGHTYLRPGQVVHRRIMDGDIVFINRPPTTHKHSLQALSVYVHDDHTVKINPLICGPLSADFDGDCIHLFYPQSLEAKAEALELFAVEKQLLSSHTGNFNLQLATDSLLSLKILFRNSFLKRAAAEQLAMFVPNVLSTPAVVKCNGGPLWTAPQIFQMSLPPCFDSTGERHAISKSEVLSLEYSREAMASIVNDIVTSLFFLKGPKEVLRFFNSIQPLLMENLFMEGFSVSLRDFFLPREVLQSTLENVQKISTNFISKSSSIGYLIDSRSESAVNKVVQQIGFLGMQISAKGKFYTEALVKDISSMFERKYPSCDNYPIEDFGLVDRPLFRGLDPYQEMVHSISSREVIVRSTRGLTEPGTLFKNLMAILRDVVICQDGTVRNMCSNSVIQFEYGVNSANIASEFCAGDPVGVLAATAMSNPAYKAVLDSSPSSNNSWEMMKEILLCGVNFKNDISDRRVILYLNNCDCGRKHCQENAALMVQNQLKKVSLKDVAVEFLIEYRALENYDSTPGLVGHIHLNKRKLLQLSVSMDNVLEKCQEIINLHQKKKKIGILFKRIILSFSDCCSFCESANVPCIQFLWQGANDEHLDKASQLLADTVYPVLLQTIIKGDPRVSSADVIWISPNSETWIRSPCKSPRGELALDIILEKESVKKSGDAWRIVMDSCLPVFHLIDTQRSIPYAIKEIQELLGISCVFEQAVQRLSTSVTMVTKGVLKDHLLLLGNSMTCAGKLIGFNAGGIKYLSRSLDVQIPFMHATLSTPRKCFERAAEKCHVDNLSSIVASCSWGKHVSVGTGSPFEIRWDTRKAELNPEKEIDVYDFLRDVSGGTNLEGMGTGCLGTEIEDLDQEDEFMEFDLSPERESGQDKPTFEDGPDFGLDGNANGFLKEDAKESPSGWSSLGKGDDSEADNWSKKAGQTAWDKKVDSEAGDWSKKSGQSTWDKKVDSEPDDLSGPSAWGKKVDSEADNWSKKAGKSTWDKKVDSEADDWSKKAGQSTWDSKVNSEENNWKKRPEGSSANEKINSDGRGNWDNKVDSKGSDWAKNSDKNTWHTEAQNNTSWGKKVGSDDCGSWGRKDEQNKLGGTSSPRKSSGQSNWAKASAGMDWGGDDTPKTDTQSSWGRGSTQTQGVFSAKAQEEGLWLSSDAQKEIPWDDSSKAAGWNIKASAVDSLDVSAAKGSSWESKLADQTQNKPNTWGSSMNWGKFVSESPSGPLDGCGSTQKQLEESTDDRGWGSSKAEMAGEKGVHSQWGRGDSPKVTGWSTQGTAVESLDDLGSKDNPWESKPADQASQGAPNNWGSSNDWSKFVSESPTGKKKESPSNWGSSQKQSDDNQGWGSTKADTSSEKDVRPQWGRGRGRGRGRGWGRGGRSREGSQGRGPSDDAEWRIKRARPDDDSSAPGLFSATKKRLDSFTVEEQDVLAETESIMKNIRRIINQMGDGDPLSTDDQNYIIENVLNHHPDKAAKMGAGIKHIMVTRHELFQDSRCFYVVSVDERKADFSYIKCLENFLRGKYPEKADAFISKYFKRSQGRQGQGWARGDRGPGSARNEAGTLSSWNTDSAPAPDEAGTPGGGWNRDQASHQGDGAQNEAGTLPSWNTDSAPAPDEAGTPGGGWNRAQNEAGTLPSWNTTHSAPAPDEAGASGGWNKEQAPQQDDAGTRGWN